MPRRRLSSITISGPGEIGENSSAQYTCTARYSNGSSRTVTARASWSEDSEYASFNSPGILTTSAVDSDTPCTITASYGGRSADLTVTIKDDQQPPVNGRIVIDPITRIEGHLRIETEVADGAVAKAWSSGTLFRGIESILKGRNPEDAWLFTQRLCGVCTYVHGSTSVRCVEDALNLTVPANARVVRNLLMGAQYLHDHIIHFYHLHALDWVDIVSALEANPSSTELQAVKARLQAFVASGQLGPFANAYWGHEAYKLTPDENLMLAAHYLKALKLQAKTARMHAIFGGKNPHVQSLRVGGVTCRHELNGNRISEFRTLLQETKAFIDNVYVPDVEYLAQKYPEWAEFGGNRNFLAYGEFPQSEIEPDSLFFPRGAIFEQGDVRDVDLSEISEHVQHSWYSGSAALHPSSGQTVPNYTGLDTAARYSWLKAPRYQGEPMEVGPLARVLVGYKRGRTEFRQAVDGFLSRTGLEVNNLYSTLGRTAARALETQIIANAMSGWLNQINTGDSTASSWSMPAQASGMGLNEAPRGALGHWIEIANQVIDNYQLVVPSTWNFGPRCSADKPGPAESALENTPVLDPQRPVEILRTVHSLDPCIACAVHVIDPGNDKAYTVRAY